MDVSSDPRPAAELVAQLSLEEKVALTSGSDTWHTVAIERLGIPALKVSDGPNGVRGEGSGTRAVCLPASIALGASFDVELVAELGRLLGRELIRKGSQILLAPTINLARHPLGGRNFESFGEEPHLTGPMAAAYIRGVQEFDVGACAKHFVANDLEEARLTVSSEVDAATLREVYLAPFERAVEAGTWSVMAAYPRLNGVYCTENPWLLTDLLRDEWGFDGLVMSDWGATHDGPAAVAAGMDLEMPGPAQAIGDRLVQAVRDGRVAIEAVDRAATAVVEMAVRSGRLGMLEEDPERAVDDPQERKLVRTAAAEGMVLLRNRPVDPATGGTGPVLPFDSSVRTVAVLGPNADPGVIQGGGSAELPAHSVVSPLAGLVDRLGEGSVIHRLGCEANRYVARVDPAAWRPLDGATEARPLVVELFDNPDLSGDPVARRWTGEVAEFHQGAIHPVMVDALRWSQRWTGRLPITVGGPHRFGVLAVGRSRVLVDGEVVADNWTDPRPGQAFFEFASEEVVGTVDLSEGAEVEVVVEWSGGGRPMLSGLRFGWQAPVDAEALLDAAAAAAAEADVAVVVVGLTAEWETESHDRLMFGLPGRQDELVRRVLAANPRTVVAVNAGGPIDLPWLDEVPATLMTWYPGQEYGSALADILFGDRDPGGRLPVTFPASLDRTPTADSVPGDGRHLHYREGLFIGHRWYSREQVEPRLAFGHGLSYATFELGAPNLDSPDGRSVSVPVTNRSDRPGKCVVQTYLRPDDPTRPRVLAGFAVVRPEPGETVVATIGLDPQALRRWEVGAEPGSGGWAPLSGTHRLEIATSSTEVAHTIELPVS